jgi:hypothetical protein
VRDHLSAVELLHEVEANVPDGRGCDADRGGTAHRAARARLPRRG